MYYISCHQTPAMASCRSSAARPVSHPTDAATARQCWTLDTVPESNCTASQTCAWGAWGWICITVRGDDIVAMLYIHVCTCMYMYIHLDTSIYKCIYIYICIYVSVYVSVNAHTHIYVYIYTYHKMCISVHSMTCAHVRLFVACTNMHMCKNMLVCCLCM